MLQLLLLLVLAYLQDNYEYPAFVWAILYGVMVAILNTLFGLGVISGLLSGVILGLYAWGYFLVLRRFGDNLIVWLMICVVGLLVPALVGVTMT